MPERSNPQRAQRSMSKLTSTGSPEAVAASKGTRKAEQTRDELYTQAAALGINGRSRMTKETLARAIAEHQAAGENVQQASRRGAK